MPVNAPVGLFATTGTSFENPGTTSRFTRRPYSSVSGVAYSHRTPAFSVKAELMRQSSLKNPSYNDPRKYLSALPNATEAASGTPSRKSAKSDPGAEAVPVAAPVKVKLPRPLDCPSELNSCFL